MDSGNYRYQFVAGNLALDFVNTVAYRADPGKKKDHLQRTEDVHQWASQAKLPDRAAINSGPRWGPRRCGASAQSANNCLRFSMQLQAMTRSRRTHLPGLAMRCTIVAPSDVCPLRERRFAGPGDLVRGVRTICFIPSSRQQPIFSPLLRAVWSVNAKTQAAAGCFWTVPTPARDGGAAWLTAATEIRPGNTTGARPV